MLACIGRKRLPPSNATRILLALKHVKRELLLARLGGSFGGLTGFLPIDDDETRTTSLRLVSRTSMAFLKHCKQTIVGSACVRLKTMNR